MWGVGSDSAVSSVRSMYRTNAVLVAMLITAIVAIIVTIFCFQTKARRGTCPALGGVRHGELCGGDTLGSPVIYVRPPPGRLILHRVQGSSVC